VPSGQGFTRSTQNSALLARSLTLARMQSESHQSVASVPISPLQAVPNLQPAMVIIGLHGSQNGLYQLSDGLATSIQIRDALYPSSRLRIVVLNTFVTVSTLSLSLPRVRSFSLVSFCLLSLQLLL